MIGDGQMRPAGEAEREREREMKGAVRWMQDSGKEGGPLTSTTGAIHQSRHFYGSLPLPFGGGERTVTWLGRGWANWRR